MTAISATFTDAQGDAAVGYVQFRPRGAIRESFLTESGIVTPVKVTVPLDGYGAMTCELEPGDYSVAIVLQGSRTIYTVATVPAAGSLDLRDILGSYMPTSTQASGIFSDPGEFEWVIPIAATKIDVVLLGGGGGGHAAGFFSSAPGGTAGVFTAQTLLRGTNIPVTTQALTGKVGAGGAAGQDGEATTLSGEGLSTLTAAGGQHGANQNYYGQGVTPTILNGQIYSGGVVQTWPSGGGNPPGGGGAGGSGFFGGPGGPGAPGRIWIRAY